MALKAKWSAPNVSLKPQVTPGFLFADDLPKKGTSVTRRYSAMQFVIWAIAKRPWSTVASPASFHLPPRASALPTPFRRN
jgi:hypothetical protein